MKNKILQKLSLGYCSGMTKAQLAASILGSIRSEKKAKSSKANGKKGGRPRTVKICEKSGEMS